MQKEDVEAILRDGLSEIPVGLTEHQVDLFVIFLRELMKWSRAYNLTALKSDRDIVIRHFVDSLLFLRFIPEGTNQSLGSEDRDGGKGGAFCICDIGSGAGFPGIPIAIARPDIRMILTEPSRKKFAFLKHVVAALSLVNTEVLAARVEDMEESLCDVVVSRALFRAGDLVRKASRVLRPRGFYIISKGPKGEEEMKNLPPNVRTEVFRTQLPDKSQRNVIKIIPNNGVDSGDQKALV